MDRHGSLLQLPSAGTGVWHNGGLSQRLIEKLGRRDHAHERTKIVEKPRSNVTARSSENTLTLLWPDSATGYRVESTSSFLPPVTWSNVAGTFQTNGGSVSIVLPITGEQSFYRLAKP
jgi:hypothetical protein